MLVSKKVAKVPCFQRGLLRKFSQFGIRRGKKRGVICSVGFRRGNGPPVVLGAIVVSFKFFGVT